MALLRSARPNFRHGGPAPISGGAPTSALVYRTTGARNGDARGRTEIGGKAARRRRLANLALALDLTHLRLDSFRIVATGEPALYRRHQHGDCELILVQEGCYRCVLNGTILELKPFDLLVVDRGDWHEEFFESRLRYLAINFNFALGARALAQGAVFAPGVSPEQHVIRGPNQEGWRIAEWLQTESWCRDQAASDIENALLHRLFRWIVRTLPRDVLSPLLLRRPPARSFGERLRLLFEHHLSENLSNAEIAAKLGMSVRSLAKRCREACGRTPAEAFKYRKIEYAAYALRHPGVAVKRVSSWLGFRSQFHFSRVFRQHLGHPPSRHRFLQP
jgi:AraC-like DNA-binding protein